MNVFVIGNAVDVRGFSLAGVPGFVCESRQCVEQQIDEILSDDPRAVLIFSAATSDLVADRCARWRREGSGPPFEFLPE